MSREYIQYTHNIDVLNSRQYIKYNDVHIGYQSHVFNIGANYISILVVVALLYIFIRSRVTDVAMQSSDKKWIMSIPRFAISMILAMPLMGVSLGAIVSRHIFKRSITVDWYSVIGGTLLLFIICNIPVINFFAIVSLYIITLVSLWQSYIIDR